MNTLEDEVLRRAARAIRSAWPFDAWDIVALAALAGFGVGVAGVFASAYAGLIAVSVPLGILAVAVALLEARRSTPEA